MRTVYCSGMADPPVLTDEDLRSVSEEAERTPTRAWSSILLILLGMIGWIGSFWLGSGGWIFLLPAIPLLALSLTILSITVHECAHGTLLGARTADSIVGSIAGLFCWTPFFSYRRGHDAHHAWIGTDRDPTPSPRGPVAPNRGLDLLRQVGVFPVFYWSGVYWPYLIYDLRHGRPVFLLANLAAIGGLHGVLAFWMGWERYAVFAILGFLGWGILYENLFTLAQHVGLAPVPAGRSRYSPREQANFSRSVPLSAAGIFFHFNLHKEHHLFPGMNFQRLPRIRELLRARRPDLYAFTDEESGWRRRGRPVHEILSPR